MTSNKWRSLFSFLKIWLFVFILYSLVTAAFENSIKVAIIETCSENVKNDQIAESTD